MLAVTGAVSRAVTSTGRARTGLLPSPACSNYTRWRSRMPAKPASGPGLGLTAELRLQVTSAHVWRNEATLLRLGSAVVLCAIMDGRIYGTSFERIPELAWTAIHPLTLIVMLSILLVRWF